MSKVVVKMVFKTVASVGSLALTLVNILCIIVTGFGILRLKEVTPEKIPQRFSNFWKRDVRAHRNFYRTLGGGKRIGNKSIPFCLLCLFDTFMAAIR
jgi:hypothetical protein